MDDTSVLDHYLAPLRPFLEPETVTEVVVNRPGEVGVEADGVWRWAEAPDLTEAWLRTLAVAAAACPVLAVGLSSPWATMAALAVFDAGLFAAQVANQATILAIDPSAPARFNSAYMLVYFVGGSLGTAFGAAAVISFGWPATVGACSAALLVAGLLTVARASRGS